MKCLFIFLGVCLEVMLLQSTAVRESGEEYDVCDSEPISVIHNSGSILSPFYPEDYPGNSNCTKHLQIPKNHRLILKAKDFDLERGIFYFITRRPKDFVQINDGPLLSGHFKDRILYDSNGANHTIRFVSDYANNFQHYRGFHIEFIVINPEAPHLTATTSGVNIATFITGNAAAVVGDQPIKKFGDNKMYLFAIGTILTLVLAMALIYTRHRRSIRQVQNTFRRTMEELICYINGAAQQPSGGTTSDVKLADPARKTYKVGPTDRHLEQLSNQRQKLLREDTDISSGGGSDSARYEYIIRVDGDRPSVLMPTVDGCEQSDLSSTPNISRRQHSASSAPTIRLTLIQGGAHSTPRTRRNDQEDFPPSYDDVKTDDGSRRNDQ